MALSNVWPPTLLGAAGGGHWNGWGELGQQKWGGFAGNCNNGPVKIELYWAITGKLSNGTGQRCTRLLSAMLSVSSSGTQQDKRGKDLRVWVFSQPCPGCALAFCNRLLKDLTQTEQIEV